MSPRFELAIAAACAAFAASFNGAEQVAHATTTDAPEPTPKARATKAAPAPVAKAPEPEPEPEVVAPTADDVLNAMKLAIASGSAAADAATAILTKHGVKRRSELKPEQYADVIVDLNALAANPPKASPLD